MTEPLFYPGRIRKPIYLFWHMWAGSDKRRFLDIVSRQYRKIVASKLVNSVDRIFVTVPADALEDVEKLMGSREMLFVVNSYTGQQHEGIAYGLMVDLLASNEIERNSYILYIHSRGASKDSLSLEGLCSDDWTRMMEYFCISRWRFCVEKLDKYYTCGCQMWPMAKGVDCSFDMHSIAGVRKDSFWTYCGNFWWANGRYLLEMVSHPSAYFSGEFSRDRHMAENWLLSSVGVLTAPEEHWVLHHTGQLYCRGLVHSYLDRYPEAYYVHGGQTPSPPLDADLFHGENNTRSSFRSKFKRMLLKIAKLFPKTQSRN
jgi:hypothetical protein